MTATLEQTQADLLRLIGVAQQGEEVVIVNQGQPVAKLTAVPAARPSPNRKAWLAKLARLREQCATGKTGPGVEEILAEDRGE
ncbi:MAG: hypothetical protein MUF81_11275 [Verrucomicrobia bacterium]|jgi:antitoxin (DNA-binding transcriptional repressor) of toxin-antitoxin stability system|nr:hypothetical protein [Verrucomicrobiota bacterium]